jgi:hypothetical protein
LGFNNTSFVETQWHALAALADVIIFNAAIECYCHFFPTHVVRSCSALCVKQRCSLITHTGADTFSPIPMPLSLIPSAAINGPTFPMLLETMLLGTLPASENNDGSQMTGR